MYRNRRTYRPSRQQQSKTNGTKIKGCWKCSSRSSHKFIHRKPSSTDSNQERLSGLGTRASLLKGIPLSLKSGRVAHFGLGSDRGLCILQGSCHSCVRLETGNRMKREQPLSHATECGEMPLSTAILCFIPEMSLPLCSLTWPFRSLSGVLRWLTCVFFLLYFLFPLSRFPLPRPGQSLPLCLPLFLSHFEFRSSERHCVALALAYRVLFLFLGAITNSLWGRAVEGPAIMNILLFDLNGGGGGVSCLAVLSLATGQ